MSSFDGRLQLYVVLISFLLRYAFLGFTKNTKFTFICIIFWRILWKRVGGGGLSVINCIFVKICIFWPYTFLGLALIHFQVSHSLFFVCLSFWQYFWDFSKNSCWKGLSFKSLGSLWLISYVLFIFSTIYLWDLFAGTLFFQVRNFFLDIFDGNALA